MVMKNTHIFGFSVVHVILLGLLLLGLTSCEDPIDVNLETGPLQLAVDGWLTDQPGPQTIKLTKTAGYFDASQPPSAIGATVIVADEDSVIHEFVDLKGNGNYVWTPKNGEVFGKIGKKYLLGIRFEGQEYIAISQMNPVPPIDSLIFREEIITGFGPISTANGSTEPKTLWFHTTVRSMVRPTPTACCSFSPSDSRSTSTVCIT
jgi:hypothetical protein